MKSIQSPSTISDTDLQQLIAGKQTAKLKLRRDLSHDGQIIMTKGEVVDAYLLDEDTHPIGNIPWDLYLIDHPVCAFRIVTPVDAQLAFLMPS